MSGPEAAESPASAPLAELLRQTALAVAAALPGFLPAPCPRAGELGPAMRHLLAGGKRVRALVVRLAAETCGLPAAAVTPTACAFELVHTATLIHDDLPCIDDADLRRGLPAVHRAFGQSTALLAGDALLVAAFGALARQAEVSATPPERVVPVIAEFAEAVGAAGVIGGEAADIAGERCPVDAERLVTIHSCKTARLFIAAARAGGLLAGAEPTLVDRLGRYADRLGLLFQVTDDLLDATGEAGQMGKPAGLDAAAGKQTYPALLGVEGARRHAALLAEETLALAASLPVPHEAWFGLVGLVRGRQA